MIDKSYLLNQGITIVWSKRQFSMWLCIGILSSGSKSIPTTILGKSRIKPNKAYQTGTEMKKKEKNVEVTINSQGYILGFTILAHNRVAEVARVHGRHPPKSLDSDENIKPEHTLFCCKLRFVAIYALFGDLWAKIVPFWVKNSVSWARSALLHGIYCIFHWANFANLRFATHLTRKL